MRELRKFSTEDKVEIVANGLLATRKMINGLLILGVASLGLGIAAFTYGIQQDKKIHELEATVTALQGFPTRTPTPEFFFPEEDVMNLPSLNNMLSTGAQQPSQ